MNFIKNKKIFLKKTNYFNEFYNKKYFFFEKNQLF